MIAGWVRIPIPLSADTSYLVREGEGIIKREFGAWSSAQAPDTAPDSGMAGTGGGGEHEESNDEGGKKEGSKKREDSQKSEGPSASADV